jgi:hypothetical protein
VTISTSKGYSQVILMSRCLEEQHKPIEYLNNYLPLNVVQQELLMKLQEQSRWTGEYEIEGIKLKKDIRIACSKIIIETLYTRWKERCKKKYSIQWQEENGRAPFARKIQWDDLPNDRIIIRGKRKPKTW